MELSLDPSMEQLWMVSQTAMWFRSRNSFFSSMEDGTSSFRRRAKSFQKRFCGNFVIATIIDVTREEKQAKQEYAKKKATIDLAQNVIYKQMMVAQNIAGLLGETTAETKTTLMKLCSLIDDESESEVR